MSTRGLACDVLVVGYGAAGAAAAIEAADAGAAVLLVEKMPSPGGLSVVSAGGARMAFDADAALAYLRRTCGGRTPDDVLRVLADGMRDFPAWLAALARDIGAELAVRPAPGNYPFEGFEALGYAEVQALPAGLAFRHPVPPRVREVSPAGARFFGLLQAHVERRPVSVLTATRVARLVRDAAGAVCGAELEDAHGSLPVQARQGVILACGGFEANARMQSDWLEPATVLNGSFLGNTGDGIRMAQELGADLWHMWHFHGPYGFRHPDPGFPYGLYVKNFPMWTPGLPTAHLPVMPWILVDQRGRRFANEYEPYPGDTGVRHFSHLDGNHGGNTRLPAWMVLDADGFGMYPLGRFVAHDTQQSFAWSADNRRELALGIFREAGSLAALAALTGVPAPALADTVQAWNAACADGHDAAFGRPPATMRALARAPFYAAPVWPLVINTQGGPVHDACQRVLDVRGRAIEGLYAAGELGSAFGHLYMAGGNLAECLVGGRAAARHAVSRGARRAAA
ncbi:FAD-dependent oxidoreductase [Cupriavidus basilensis]|uniref:FAD-dependent oxidoreductase n=1 Tax=Cupriavidus basilensis TaxID=68895 RepID=UPI000750CB86|nr:FAD-dependent oxidoreductase [Cupriavidus basilensis]